jgi:hypothetical protein
MDGWDEIRGLSPEEQTDCLKRHLRDWDQFVEGIRASEEELQAYRAAGGIGLPPSWITVEEYRRRRGLPGSAD